jgi:hypothetical protein
MQPAGLRLAHARLPGAACGCTTAGDMLLLLSHMHGHAAGHPPLLVRQWESRLGWWLAAERLG